MWRLAADVDDLQSSGIAAHDRGSHERVSEARLERRDVGLEIPLLPAISADGTTVVFAKMEPRRGEPFVPGTHPTLELIAKTRDDIVTSRLVVLAADEADAMFDAGAMKPELQARVEAANRWLAQLDDRYHLVPLEELDVVSALAMPSHVRSHAVGLGMVVDWVTGRLQVIRRNARGGPGHRLVGVTTPASWQSPDHPTTCALSPPNLDTVHGDPTRNVIVLEIGYAGTDPDRCVRPPTQVHVVAW